MRPLSICALVIVMFGWLVSIDVAEARRPKKGIGHDKKDLIAENDSLPENNAPSHLRLFIQAGLQMVFGLNSGGTAKTTEIPGVPFGCGISYSAGEHLIFDANLAYMIIPEWKHIYGYHENWSIFEFGMSVTYLPVPDSDFVLYLKPGLKMARLRSSQKQGYGLFGSTSGENLQGITDFVPAFGFAIGFSLTSPVKRPSLYCEMALEYIPLDGKIVRGTNVAKDWEYPSNLTAFGINLILQTWD